MLNFIKQSFRFSIKSILAFSLLSFLICVAVFSRSYPDQFSFRDMIWFPIGILLCAGLYYLWIWLLGKSNRFTIFFLSTLSLACYGIGLVSFDTQPVSDYKMIWQTANEIANGTFDANLLKGYDYMAVYHWQIGMAVLESVLIKLFGSHFTVLKVFSCVCSLLISYLVYVITSSKIGLSAGKAAYVLSAVFVSYIMSVNQLSNHQFGTIFLLLSLYFLDKQKYKFALLGGILAAVLNVFRAIAIIVLVAAIVIAIYRMLRDGKVAFHLKNLALTLIGYAISTALFSVVFLQLHYTSGPITENRIPYFKFHKGLTEYSEPFTDLKRFDGNQQEFNNWEKKEVGVLLGNPKGTAVFVANKMVRFLGLFDGQFEHTYNQDETVWKKNPVRAFYSIGWMQYAIYVLLALIGYSWWCKRNDLDIFQVWFVGNTLVYLFIEAISHYRFEHYIFIFMMAGCGFTVIKNRFSAKAEDSVIS
ncbi:glycosyltransferase family protein [Flavobacterium silvaticum]|uniref:Glycosyltransferase family 39 protein n=1 Tax=Flavobacterium silvaticum TaxID=1852020 RepID=A0A972FLU9_9FLAO|nr:hypothetical protein [Flavobacterium silvaticum]NMH28022.1 glycosyltransferase family 39 protein [Flavobacterium silvaticum]